jgi:hypothetical protein
MSFISNPRRDASSTIAGFLFQANVTILRWLELGENEHLELECGEDIDTVRESSTGSTELRLLEQIKARSGRSVTLRSEEALEALANFCSHRKTNPTSTLKFRYVTTANNGVEQGWERAESGIETWSRLQRGMYSDTARSDAFQAIRKFLKSCPRPQKASVDAWQALQQVLASDDESVLLEVILAFEFGLGYGDYAQIENEVLKALPSESRPMTAEERMSIYEHLLAFVFRLLCSPGPKILTAIQLRAELQPATASDLAILQLVRNELGEMSVRIASVEATAVRQEREIAAIKQTVGLIGKSFGFDSAFALSAASLSTDVPDSVSPRAERDALVAALLNRAQTDGIVALSAEPGSGKTQLLILALTKAQRATHWLNMPRAATEAEACILIGAFVRAVCDQTQKVPFRESCEAAAEQFKGTLVVIEDLPSMIPNGALSTRLVTLGRCLKSVGAFLLTSSYFRLPAGTQSALGEVHFDIPRFTSADIAEVLSAANAPQHIQNEQIVEMLRAITEGLPALVMAAVRYLADQNWKFTATEIESLFTGEFAAAHRHDASALLQVTVPDKEERELLIRMSLAIGTFTMEDIASVARVAPAISMPGEKVQRATGLWLQRMGTDRYVRSPLVTSEVAEALDPETRQNVHFVLAVRILARKSLQLIEAFTCVRHLMMAGDTPFAVTVVLQALVAIVEHDEQADDDFGFSRMWPTSEALSGVDVNLQMSLRAMQMTLLIRRGQDVRPMVEALDALIANAGARGWGVAVATSGLAINLMSRSPILANKYLLIALGSYESARLPDGSPLPPLAHPLEQFLWVSAYHCKSDADIDSWLATISSYGPAQLEVLKHSELMEDNVTILCDGIWMRVYQRLESDRSWAPVKEKLEQVEATARAIDFQLLEAAAIRTRIMVLAEWDDQLEAAVALSESSLDRFNSDDCRFLILEVTGRQLSYARKSEQAVQWLNRALDCNAFHHSLWRRNVLITVAELHGAIAPVKAAEFTAEAVRISKEGRLVETILIETLVEHGMALWRAGKDRESFATFEDAINRLLVIESEANRWKGLFARAFNVIAYFSAIAANRRPPDGQTEPEQGLFLSSNEQAYAWYRPEQLAYVCVRLAMLADGVKDISKAAEWTWKSIESAKRIPTAWNTVRLSAWHALPAALLVDDFAAAAELVAVMTDIDPQQIISDVLAKTTTDVSSEAPRISPAISPSSPAAKSALRVIPIVPVAIRLACLQFQGANSTATLAFLAVIEATIAPAIQPESFVAVIRRALVVEQDWQLLWDESNSAFQNNEYVRGIVLGIGAIDKAPVRQSLYLQVSVAKNLEGFFATCPSIYREIVALFFVAYWRRVIVDSTGLFRTAQSYTQRELTKADGTPDGTRKLLSAMCFCLGLKLPEDATNWLDGSGSG